MTISKPNSGDWMRRAIADKLPQPISQSQPEPVEPTANRPGPADQGGGTGNTQRSSAGWLNRAIDEAITKR